MTSTKKSISALEMQRQLGHKFYEPVWYMMQKIRKSMGARDGQYPIIRLWSLMRDSLKVLIRIRAPKSAKGKRKSLAVEARSKVL
ncbi:MAG: hypothetical protein ACOC3S_02140 [Bacteroidota bacterium]